MKHAQLLFVGTFHSPPEYSYIRALRPDIRLLCCTDLSQLPASLDTSIIITSILWLETLSKSEKKQLTQAAGKCWQWIGINDVGVNNDTVLHWLESGINHLLPPELEQPLLRLLTRYQPVSESDQAVVLLLAEAKQTTSRFESLLQKQNISSISINRNSTTVSPDQIAADLILAIDRFGVNQVRILKSQQGFAALPVIYLTETSAAQDPLSLPDTYAMIPNDLAETLLPDILKQFQQDITEQRSDAQNSPYLNSIQRLTRVLGQHAIISTTDRAGRIIYTNKNFCSISGYSQHDLIGQTHRILKSGHHSISFYKKLWQTIKNGEVWHGVFCNRNKSGQLYWVCSRMLPLRNSSGKVTSYICIGSDISSLQQSRSLLHEFDQLVSNIQGQAQLVPWVMDVKNQNICWSMHAVRVLGFKEANAPLNADQLLSMIHPDDRKRVKGALITSMKKRTQFETELRIAAPDGSKRWFSAKGLTIYDKDDQPVHIQGVLEDINAQKIAEKMISGSLSLFRQMFNSSDNCIAIADSRGKIVFINPAYTRVMGYCAAEVIGLDCRDLVSSNYTIATQLVDKLLREKQNWKGTTTRRRKDGSEFIALNLAGPIQDESGTITHLYVTFTDITQELQNQQELTQAKATAEQANRAKSEFITRMSHELRTPMNSILGFAQLLLQDPELASALQQDAREIFRAGSHLLQLINDLLDLSKIESGQIRLHMEQVSLNHVIAECEALLRPMTQARQIRLLSDNIQDCIVFTDRLRLKQVILNLLTNAIIYSPPDEEVTINAFESDNGRIKVEFIDNGPGIPAALIDKLFIPFQRLDQTSAKVEGSGIGLTISQELVELMGGEVSVSSQPGEGAISGLSFLLLPNPIIIGLYRNKL
ncbi:PAS domain S-box protein [uncultured Amphritea sp.]|uniref:sensor histidine kinase n=1 Tax=uncultured Amphritea sp. TaxID=981605 RepID=UPI0026077305|nr:PAS domain S-box protein [uncultured Amphritea sp.]